MPATATRSATPKRRAVAKGVKHPVPSPNGPQKSAEARPGALSLAWKSRFFAAVVILTNSFGNYFIARGMKALSVPADSPLALIKAIFTPNVIMGILLLITWLLARMMFLSFADLSYMLPITAFGYVVSALLGMWLLGETISLWRWVGTGLITGGTMLVGSGTPHASSAAEHPR